MTNLSQYDKDSLFNGFLLMIKRPDKFPIARENAEIWLSNTDNTVALRPYKDHLGKILYQEVLPEVIQKILKDSHDDFVESLDEQGLLERYRASQSPRRLLEALA